MKNLKYLLKVLILFIIFMIMYILGEHYAFLTAVGTAIFLSILITEIY
jgi:phage-related protein